MVDARDIMPIEVVKLGPSDVGCCKAGSAGHGMSARLQG